MPQRFTVHDDPFFQVHVPEPLDGEMLGAVRDSKQLIHETSVRYYMAYLTCVAAKLRQPKRCAVVNPYFTFDGILQNVDAVPPRSSEVPLLFGRKLDFDYLLVPIYDALHFTLGFWRRDTEEMVFYNPSQPGVDRRSPRAAYRKAISALLAELRYHNYDVTQDPQRSS